MKLLKTDAYGSGKLGLRYVRLHANRGDLPAHILISRVRATLVSIVYRCVEDAAAPSLRKCFSELHQSLHV
ncbi:hypothetical protein X738_29835 [Mesorhizobium sp. LNHC209A00]|nr:hypothetical protein X738_29835 [Mesorhizobium sp. LNHC209A00]